LAVELKLAVIDVSEAGLIEVIATGAYGAAVPLQHWTMICDSDARLRLATSIGRLVTAGAELAVTFGAPTPAIHPVSFLLAS
jgi:hypothetical protein